MFMHALAGPRPRSQDLKGSIHSSSSVLSGLRRKKEDRCSSTRRPRRDELGGGDGRRAGGSGELLGVLTSCTELSRDRPARRAAAPGSPSPSSSSSLRFAESRSEGGALGAWTRGSARRSAAALALNGDPSAISWTALLGLSSKGPIAGEAGDASRAAWELRGSDAVAQAAGLSGMESTTTCCCCWGRRWRSSSGSRGVGYFHSKDGPDLAVCGTIRCHHASCRQNVPQDSQREAGGRLACGWDQESDSWSCSTVLLRADASCASQEARSGSRPE